MKTSTAWELLCIVVISLSILGCNQVVQVLPTPTRDEILLEKQNPQIHGTIESVFRQNEMISGIYVVGKIEANTEFDKAYVSINKDTKIYIKDQSGYHTSGIAQLAEGKTVAILFTGPIADSYPVQATAMEIAIEE
jgi:hypothetical protein